MRNYLAAAFRQAGSRPFLGGSLNHTFIGRCLERETHRGVQRVLSTTTRMEVKKEKNRAHWYWTKEQLINRVTELEELLAAKTGTTLPPPRSNGKTVFKEPHIDKPFDPSKYSTRLIALKLAYLGKNYHGFEHHSGQRTVMPTIEEELWKALAKGKLIFPTGNQEVGGWEGCEYSKCGRTDKGVSAFGQVIGVRVRSNRPLPRKKVDMEGTAETATSINDGNLHDISQQRDELEIASLPLALSTTISAGESEELQLSDPDLEQALDFNPIADEIPYASLLNKLLPPDIRILAWCPSPPLDFSARFSCRERRYKYFFTQPAFLPLPHSLDPFSNSSKSSGIKDGWLDIAAMKAAAKLFEGAHDFRNFCKVDASKQIDNFERRIFRADIEEVPDTTQALEFLNNEDLVPPRAQMGVAPKVYTFTLHGSAFLWHQVRHMVAILFLVGQGLESPSLVSELLDTEKNPRRPIYEMASDTPLVLWDCIFPKEGDDDRNDALEWLYVGDAEGQGQGKYGVPSGGLMGDMWNLWRERKIDEVLAAGLMGLIAQQGKELKDLSLGKVNGKKSQRVFDGDNNPRLKGNYEPVMRKERMDPVEVINERYAVRKGFESSEEMKKLGFRRMNKPEGVDE